MSHLSFFKWKKWNLYFAWSSSTVVNVNVFNIFSVCWKSYWINFIVCWKSYCINLCWMSWCWISNPEEATHLTTGKCRLFKLYKYICYLPRDLKDEDYAYSVVTRVPTGLKDKHLCQRLEQRYSVGPLVVNREVVLMTRTGLKNNRTIFTDNNGYQMMKRTYKAFANNSIPRVS